MDSEKADETQTGSHSPVCDERKDSLSIEESESDEWARRTFVVTMGRIYCEAAKVKYAKVMELLMEAQALKAEADLIMARVSDLIDENQNEVGPDTIW